MSHATDRKRPALAGAARPRRPHLRLLEAQPTRPGDAVGESPQTSDLRREQGGDQVLVAGADAPARARMLAELRSLLPQDTLFLEASETWEVVAGAAGSRMVVLAGDLGDASSSSLLRLLARRNPALPVLAVGGGDRPSIGSSLAPRLQASAHTGAPGGHEHRGALDAAQA